MHGVMQQRECCRCAIINTQSRKFAPGQTLQNVGAYSTQLEGNQYGQGVHYQWEIGVHALEVD